MYSVELLAPIRGYRIGEFSRRVGLTPELLRAWESRYGLFEPARSAGGFRIYGEEDAERAVRMRQALADGLSAAEAASVALSATVPAGRQLIERAQSRLLHAIRCFDEGGVQAALDDALGAFGIELFVREVVLPTLTTIGGEWRAGRIDVGQEHFASHLVRGRLLSLARLWGRGSGPLALLACVPGEQHDISLIAFGLVLRSYGWRILFLGADTPVLTLEATARATSPSAVVIVSFDAPLMASVAPALRRLGREAPLFLAGPGADAGLAAALRLERLDGDLIDAARRIAGTAAPDGA